MNAKQKATMLAVGAGIPVVIWLLIKLAMMFLL